MGQTGSCQLAILISIGCAASLFARGARPAAFVAQVASGGPNLSGTWTLDSYLSDNPEQDARELRFDTGQSSLEESREPMEGERYGGRGMGRGGFGRGGF